MAQKGMKKAPVKGLNSIQSDIRDRDTATLRRKPQIRRTSRDTDWKTGDSAACNLLRLVSHHGHHRAGIFHCELDRSGAGDGGF